jgi:hypothetical protein
MKTLSVIVIIHFVVGLFVGCGSSVPYIARNYEIGKQLTATTGGVMIRWEKGWRSSRGVRPYESTIRELIFGGIEAGIIHIAYREYSQAILQGTYIRPAFNQDLRFDYNKSARILFQDFVLVVRDVADGLITFSVIEESPSMVAFVAAARSDNPTFSSIGMIGSGFVEYPDPIYRTFTLKAGGKTAGYVFAEDSLSYALSPSLIAPEFSRFMKSDIAKR